MDCQMPEMDGYEAHRASGMRKLGLRSHTELVRFAVARGLLPEAR